VQSKEIPGHKYCFVPTGTQPGHRLKNRDQIGTLGNYAIAFPLLRMRARGVMTVSNCHIVIHYVCLCLITTPELVTYLPRAHAQGGKVISLVVVVVVVVVVVTLKIGISRDLGTRKPNESIGFGEKLVSLCFKSKETVHERQK
jgi:hypothetical protein